MKNDKNDVNTINIFYSPSGITMLESQKINTISNKKYDLCVNWGKYWNDFEETYSVGVSIVEDLIYREKVNGSTYIEVMSTEFGVPMLELKNNMSDSFPCEVMSIDNPQLEKTKEQYMRYIPKEKSDIFDNVVFVIKDDPRYSSSNKDYITTSIIVCSKEHSFIINTGYPIGNDFTIKSEQFTKKLNLFK